MFLIQQIVLHHSHLQSILVLGDDAGRQELVHGLAGSGLHLIDAPQQSLQKFTSSGPIAGDAFQNSEVIEISETQTTTLAQIFATKNGGNKNIERLPVELVPGDNILHEMFKILKFVRVLLVICYRLRDLIEIADMEFGGIGIPARDLPDSIIIRAGKLGID